MGVNILFYFYTILCKFFYSNFPNDAVRGVISTIGIVMKFDKMVDLMEDIPPVNRSNRKGYAESNENTNVSQRENTDH